MRIENEGAGQSTSPAEHLAASDHEGLVDRSPSSGSLRGRGPVVVEPGPHQLVGRAVVAGNDVAPVLVRNPAGGTASESSASPTSEVRARCRPLATKASSSSAAKRSAWALSIWLGAAGSSMHVSDAVVSGGDKRLGYAEALDDVSAGQGGEVVPVVLLAPFFRVGSWTRFRTRLQSVRLRTDRDGRPQGSRNRPGRPRGRSDSSQT